MIDRTLWMKALEEATAVATAAGENTVTVKEFRALFNLGRAAAERKLGLLVAQGRARMLTAMRPDTAGRLQQHRVYQLLTDPMTNADGTIQAPGA